MRRLRFHARPVTWLIAAGVGIAITARHLGLRRSKAEQAAVDRRVRHDRRSGVDRRTEPAAAPPEGERRSGTERRAGSDRRGGSTPAQ